MTTSTLEQPQEEEQQQSSPRTPRTEDILFFPDHTQIHIPGFEYYPSYVTAEESEKIMQILDNNEWIKEIRRRQQHYGYVYYHTRHNLPTVQPSSQSQTDPHNLPLSQFDFLLERLRRDGIFPNRQKNPNEDENSPTQILVNEYLENTRIASHVDNVKAFGDVIVGLSLLQPCYMTMRNSQDENQETRIYLAPRSLYVMRGEARYGWKHGITQMKHFVNPANLSEVTHRDENYRRVSLTFRKILIQGTKNGENPDHEEQLTWRRSSLGDENEEKNRQVMKQE